MNNENRKAIYFRFTLAILYKEQTLITKIRSGWLI